MQNDMAGKTCIVTGATSGIGLETAAGLARLGATVVMPCRDAERGAAAREVIVKKASSGSVLVMDLDLASQESIRSFAEAFKRDYEKLDVLVNNAAIMPLKREETPDGLETQFGVNHIGMYLLTHLLVDTLRESGSSRVVNVSSTLHQSATLDFDDLQSLKKYSAFGVYGWTKLANVLFTYELTRRLEGSNVTANCLPSSVLETPCR